MIIQHIYSDYILRGLTLTALSFQIENITLYIKLVIFGKEGIRLNEIGLNNQGYHFSSTKSRGKLSGVVTLLGITY